MTLYVSTGDGVGDYRTVYSTGDVVVGNGAIHISTGDGMVGYGVVDTYCEGY